MAPLHTWSKWHRTRRCQSLRKSAQVSRSASIVKARWKLLTVVRYLLVVFNGHYVEMRSGRRCRGVWWSISSSCLSLEFLAVLKIKRDTSLHKRHTKIGLMPQAQQLGMTSINKIKKFTCSISILRIQIIFDVQEAVGRKPVFSLLRVIDTQYHTFSTCFLK